MANFSLMSALPHPQEQSFQIFALLVADIERMIERMPGLHDHLDIAPGIHRRGVHNLTEKRAVDVVGAGVGGENAAGSDLPQAAEVDVLISPGGLVHLGLAGGKRGRVEHDHIPDVSGGVEIPEHVRADEFGGNAIEPVQRQILPRQIKRRTGGIHGGHRRRAPRRCIHAESAGIGKEIQHALPAGELPDDAP